jgi:hypothetical protein
MSNARQRVGMVVAVAAGLWAGSTAAVAAAPAAMPPVEETRPGYLVHFAGEGCLSDGRAGDSLQFELRGADGGTRVLPMAGANGRPYDTMAPDHLGEWAVNVLVPKDVTAGAYAVVPVCGVTEPARRFDLPGGVKVLRVLPAEPATDPTPVPPVPTTPPATEPTPPVTTAPRVGPAPTRPAAVPATPRFTG